MSFVRKKFKHAFCSSRVCGFAENPVSDHDNGVGADDDAVFDFRGTGEGFEQGKGNCQPARILAFADFGFKECGFYK